ncbi:hypothetical protein GTZ78_05005 [Streptomyces sp. SID8361]|nr:hypothetical protein [Streptomyces sp. SID8361]
MRDALAEYDARESSVGRLISETEVPVTSAAEPGSRLPEVAGSIIVVVATDAPLLPSQCRRLTAQSSVGLSGVRRWRF